MQDAAKVKLTIDGKEVFVEEGTTILEVARHNGIHIPTLCHHSALSKWGGCRVCVVEVDGAPRLVASCVTPVRAQMEVVTTNQRIVEARRTIVEFLFAERNHYCMFCAQSGDCELQGLAYELQMDHLTVAFSFNKFPVDATSEYMALDHNRCILCGRCVRACRELAGNYVLNYQNRGTKSLICKDLNEVTESSACDSSGVCMQVCPTGAIFNRYRTHYAVKGKERKLETKESSCPQCGLLCPTVSSVRDNNLVKIDGVLDSDRPDRGQLCHIGRFEPLKSGRKRLLHPVIREAGGEWVDATWEMALDLVAERLNAISEAGDGQAVLGLVSDRCSNEELLLFRDVLTKGWKADHVETFTGSQLRNIALAWKGASKAFLALKEASWKRVLESDYILFAGADPQETQPLLSALARRSVFENGAKLGVIGPTDVMQPWTTHYLSPKQGHEASLLKALLADVVASTKKSRESAHCERIARDIIGEGRAAALLKKAGLDADSRKAFEGMVRSFIESKNPIVVAGEGVTGLKGAHGLKYLMHLTLLKGLLPEDTLRLLILKPGGNSACALRLGLSRNGKRANGTLRRGGLILLAGEEIPGHKLPDTLEGLEFMAVLSPYFPESLAVRAHVLLPKPVWLEEGGTYTSLDGREIGRSRAVLKPPSGVSPSWKTMAALARRTRFRPDFDTWEDLNKKVLQEMGLGGQTS